MDFFLLNNHLNADYCLTTLVFRPSCSFFGRLPAYPIEYLGKCHLAQNKVQLSTFFFQSSLNCLFRIDLLPKPGVFQELRYKTLKGISIFRYYQLPQHSFKSISLISCSLMEAALIQLCPRYSKSLKSIQWMEKKKKTTMKCFLFLFAQHSYLSKTVLYTKCQQLLHASESPDINHYFFTIH